MGNHRHREKNSAGEIDKYAGHSIQMFARKFWASLILTVPVLIFSDFWSNILNLQPISFAGSKYISLVFGSVIFFYGGWIFIVGAAKEIKVRLPGMMTLIGIAISTAYFYSLYVVLVGDGKDLFWELATLITVMLLGHYLEMRAVGGTQSALKELSRLIPDTAEISIGGNRTKVIKISELKAGDILLIRPGARVPADGEIIEGESDIDESLVTGESKPVGKKAGEDVIAGTINGDGSLKVKVSKIGKDTFLAGVTRLVADAQASKSKLQILSDRAAFYLTIVAIFFGALTFIIWIFLRGDFSFALERLVTVLVIACPHALGLAVPLVASVSTMLAARNGFLVRERLALEQARNVDVVLFDKTGTLTSGEFKITEIFAVSGYNENKILTLAASLEREAEHFIGKAIVKEARRRKLGLLAVENFAALKGRGAQGKIERREALIGGENLILEKNIELPESFQKWSEEKYKEVKTIVYLIAENEAIGAIALADIPRKESKEAVRNLKAMGIRVAMITGDSEEVASYVAKKLGISEFFAKVLPENKAKKIRELQLKGYRTAMVGDGINDAPALAQADLGIAVGAGTSMAIESAGIILVRNNPLDIVKIIRLSRETYRKMIQNLFWATGYNIIALPLAAGVLAFKGIFLAPALGAVFMSLSTVIVAVNALFLRKIKI